MIQLRNSIQGQIDAQAKNKQTNKAETESSDDDDELDDPAQLEVVRENGHRETFTLVKRQSEETV